MHKRIKQLIRIFLVMLLAVFLTNFIVKKVNLAKTDEEIGVVNQNTRDQTLRNEELNDILSEENQEDFYRNQAEDKLGYGYPNEKVYQDITGY